MLVDSHCHLDFPKFSEDLDQVVDRAAAQGVKTLLTIATGVTTFPRVAAVAARFDNVFCTIGIHPHEAAKEPMISAEVLLDAAAGNHKVVGFGETGLDYYYQHSPRDVQKQQFITHIEAAREADLPLVIHTRDADDDMAALLRQETVRGGGFRGLLHCFSSSRQLAETALELGLYISLSGIVTFKKADDLQGIVADIPLDRMLVETDAPYLAPVPHRGQRNEPAFTVHTAEKVAELKGISFAELAQATTENFFTLFQRATPPTPHHGGKA